MLAEHILSNGALPERIDDKFQSANKEKATNRAGIYINYAIPKSENYSALAMDNSKMTIAFKNNEDKIAEQIREDLESLGLEYSRHFEILEID